MQGFDAGGAVAVGPEESWSLTPFERYMLADDRGGWPMTFPMRFCFSGEVDLEALRSALPEVLKRHPLLDCRLEGHRRLAGWRRSTNLPHDDTESRETFQHPVAIDPRRSRPFRWTWRSTKIGGNLELIMHHAAVDGVGAIGFVGDWLAAYDRRVTEGSRTRSKTLRPEALATRCSPPSSPQNTDGSAWKSVTGIARECQRFFARRVTPIAPPKQVAPEKDGEASLIDPLACRLFDERDSQALREQAELLGVTLNDLAMRDLFLTLRQWNQANEAVGRWYRITMPANLRDRSQLRMPAGNQIGYAFLDRDLSGSVDPVSLLSSIAAENASIRQHDLASMFLTTLHWANKAPGAMRWLTRPSSVMATAVFTNVGDPVRRFLSRLPSSGRVVSAGGLTLEAFEAAPPTRPGTHAAFCLSQYAGRIQLCVSPSPAHLASRDAEGLISLWHTHLKRNLSK